MSASTAVRKSTHIVVPGRSRIDATKGTAAGVAYVAQCVECPWHAKFPVAFRILVAQAALEGVKVGSTIAVEHATKPGSFWLRMRILGIVTTKDGQPSIEGKADIKEDGRNPVGWAIAPKPAEAPEAG